jgi:hypothetical protein
MTEKTDMRQAFFAVAFASLAKTLACFAMSFASLAVVNSAS